MHPKIPRTSISTLRWHCYECLLTCPTYRKINTSPNTVEDPALLKLPLSKPLIRKIDLHFPLGKEVTARNLKGVTIKDALDAIHKAYKKRVSPDHI